MSARGRNDGSGDRVLRGSCLCGGVRYEARGTAGAVGHCHCPSCRKSQGAAFATNASVRRDDFRVTAGEELLRGYESSPGKRRHFCGRCGAKLYATAAAAPGIVRIRLGSLDDDPGVRPRAHIWTSLRAPWQELTGDLPRFEKEPPGRDEVV